MACPTCSHTMHSVNDVCWWCPRCGTLRFKHLDQLEVPKLVDRCRQFQEGKYQVADWRRLGIQEAILPENQRV
jgi:Zn-finger nucleic acid-binding protein